MPNTTHQTLHGTNPLTFEGDLAAQMVEGLDSYVTEAIADSVEKRATLWNRDYSSHEAYTESVEPNRERFKKLIGCIDERLPIETLSYVATTRADAEIAATDTYTVSRVRWQVFDGVEGEGLLLEPINGMWTSQVVALPDADWSPEMIAGVTEEPPPGLQPVTSRRTPRFWETKEGLSYFAGRLAEAGMSGGCSTSYQSRRYLFRQPNARRDDKSTPP